jgi:hypothetical protein
MAAQMDHPAAQDGIGEQAHATVLDQHGGVADVGDAKRRAYAAGAPRLSSASWSAVS